MASCFESCQGCLHLVPWMGSNQRFQSCFIKTWMFKSQKQEYFLPRYKSCVGDTVPWDVAWSISWTSTMARNAWHSSGLMPKGIKMVLTMNARSGPRPRASLTEHLNFLFSLYPLIFLLENKGESLPPLLLAMGRCHRSKNGATWSQAFNASKMV